MFTINDHIFDNSIQTNIKFAFTLYEYEYIVAYEFILISNIYIYTYIYIYIYIYKLCVFSYCNIVATHIHDGHTGFTFT